MWFGGKETGRIWTRDVGNGTMDNGPGTADMGTNRQRRARARPKYPLLHQGNLIISILLLWGT